MPRNYKKPLLVAGVASTIALGTMSGAGVVSAATDTDASTDHMSGLVDKLSSKFKLDKSEVKAVFDQDRSERQAERQKQVEERLTQAVTDGKITAEQKAAILAKQAELKEYHGSIEDKTRSERRELMKAKMDELKTWADENNIPTEYLRPGLGHGHGHGGRM